MLIVNTESLKTSGQSIHSNSDHCIDLRSHGLARVPGTLEMYRQCTFICAHCHGDDGTMHYIFLLIYYFYVFFLNIFSV
jgi:hypothetical protein